MYERQRVKVAVHRQVIYADLKYKTCMDIPDALRVSRIRMFTFVACSAEPPYD